MRKTLALILALVLALSCMGFAVAEPVAEQVEEAVAEIEEVAIGATAEEVEAPVEEIEEAELPVVEEAPVEEEVVEEPAETYVPAEETTGSDKDHVHVYNNSQIPFEKIPATNCTEKNGMKMTCVICGFTIVVYTEADVKNADSEYTVPEDYEIGGGYKNAKGEEAPGYHVQKDAPLGGVHYAATCTADEYYLVSECAICGAKNVKNTIKFNEDASSAVDKDGNPTTDPSKFVPCDKALGHEFDPNKGAKLDKTQDYKEPTCTETGYGTYFCAHNCGATQKVTLPKKPHEPEKWYIEGDPAELPDLTIDYSEQLDIDPVSHMVTTCKEGGWAYKLGSEYITYCKNCFTILDAKKDDVITTKPLDHEKFMVDTFFTPNYVTYDEYEAGTYTMDKLLVDEYETADGGKFIINPEDVVSSVKIDGVEYVTVNGQCLIKPVTKATVEAALAALPLKDHDQPHFVESANGGIRVTHIEFMEKSEPDARGAQFVQWNHYGAMTIKYVAPSCEKAGSLTVTCDECGASHTETIPAMGHKWYHAEDSVDNLILGYSDEFECTTPGYQEHMICRVCAADRKVGYFSNHDIITWSDVKQVIDDKTMTDAEKAQWFSANNVQFYQMQTNDTKLKKYFWPDLKLCLDYEVRMYCRNQIGWYLQETKNVDAQGVGTITTVKVPKYCSHYETKSVKAPKEHSYKLSSDLVPTATCTEDGYEFWYCEYCQKVISKPIAALGHVAKKVDKDGKAIAATIEKEPTCTETGIRAYDCARCGEKNVCKETIPALDHRYVETYIEGKTVRWTVKNDKGETLTVDGKVAKYDDTNIAYTYYSCTETGVRTDKCSRCGAVREVKFAPMHQWFPGAATTDAEFVAKNAEALANFGAANYVKPTCTTAGAITGWCYRCHLNVTNLVLPALKHDRDRAGYDHEYHIEYDNNAKNNVPAASRASARDKLYEGVWYTGYVPATCDAAAYYWYICADCGKEVKKEVGEKNPEMHTLNVVGSMSTIFSDDVILDENMLDQIKKYQENGYKIDGIVIDKMPTCQATGHMYYICDRCKKTVSFDLPALPHNYTKVWNNTKQTFEFKCNTIKKSAYTPTYKPDGSTWASYTTTEAYDNILASRYPYGYPSVRTKIVERMYKLASGTNMYGVGGHSADMQVEKLRYKITKVSDTVVNVRKDSDTADATWPVIYVSWQFTLKDGTNFSYNKTFETYVDSWDGKEGRDIRIGNANTPDGATLDAIWVIACDDLDLEMKGQYEANHLDIGYANVK